MLPVAKMKLPSCLKGERNGLLPSSVLKSTGLSSFRLAEPAARSVKPLIVAAAEAGFRVWFTGTYRSLAGQVDLFTSRYTNSKVNGVRPVWWNNRRWWKRAGVAQAAKPGSSNHGWGLAADFCLRTPNSKKVLPVSSEFVNWMCENAHRWGWSAELQSEPWHWRYVAGDDIPQEVLAYEEGK